MSSNYSPKFNSTGHRLTIQTIHLPKLLCSEMAATEPTRYLSNPMFYSTNTQTNLGHWRVLRKEWDHQVWGQSNFVWVTNRRLEDNRFSATKSGQISRSSFITVVAFSLRMEARVFHTCLLGNNLNRWFIHQLDDAQPLDLWAIFTGHKALLHMEGIPI